MNGIGIRVTPEQLRQVAVQLNGAAGDIDGTLRQLAASVEPLGRYESTEHGIATSFSHQ